MSFSYVFNISISYLEREKLGLPFIINTLFGLIVGLYIFCHIRQNRRENRIIRLFLLEFDNPEEGQVMLANLALGLHIRNNINTKLNIVSITVTEDSQEECPICKETYKTNDKICKNSCSHEFHFSCLEEWIKQNPSCPFCQTEIPILIEN